MLRFIAFVCLSVTFLGWSYGEDKIPPLGGKAFLLHELTTKYANAEYKVDRFVLNSSHRELLLTVDDFSDKILGKIDYQQKVVIYYVGLVGVKKSGEPDPVILTFRYVDFGTGPVRASIKSIGSQEFLLDRVTHEFFVDKLD